MSTNMRKSFDPPNYTWPLKKHGLRELRRYIAVGLFVGFFFISIFHISLLLGLPHWLSALVSNICTAPFALLLHARVTFGKILTISLWKRFFMVTFATAIFSELVFAFLADTFVDTFLIVLCWGLLSILNYLSYKKFVFTEAIEPVQK
jgi:hypothetical protein